MRRLVMLVAFAGAFIGCDRANDEPEPDEPARAPGHEHEKRHDEVPRTVALPDEVVEQAGIVTVPVERRTLAPTVRLPGEITADPDRQASVAARIDGTIETIRVQPGDAVAKGDVLASVRAPSLQSLRAAEASLKAKAASARANAERLAALVEKRMASQQEALAAKAEAESLEAEARAARERLRALGVSGSKRRSILFDVSSPIDGIVLERDVVVGAPVDSETVVARIAATDEVWFIGHVFERDVSRVEVGRFATVRLNAYADRVFEGTVEYVSHQVDPGARTLSARIPLTNADGHLRLGLYGTAHVVAVGEQGAPVLTVPVSAVSQMLGEPVVFVRHDDGHFEVHQVVLGDSDTKHTEVVHGLREGEEVVSEGGFSVKSALLRDSFAEGE